MDLNIILLILSGAVLIISTVTLVITLVRTASYEKRLGKLAESLKSVSDAAESTERRLSSQIDGKLSSTRTEITSGIRDFLSAFSSQLSASQKNVFEQNDKRIEQLSESLGERQDSLRRSVSESVSGLDERFVRLCKDVENMSEQLRETLDARMKEMRAENEKQLAEIRSTVDEKLQQTLEDRISRSFKDVSERLEQVYKGLGEMQTLASGVGDLKKVLSNVKTRGILGEIQLGAILEQILSPDQYETNVATVSGSKNVVEFAVKLPGAEDGKCVYLPIDSKFPTDAYYNLSDAYESGDPQAVSACGSVFERRLTDFAKDIHDKYVSPPDTTDFAVMFLPTEGIYAEAVKRGMPEKLSELRISIAGPTTMAALLNSLQMGFRTLAIQKRSSEVWEILQAVKTEFGKFEDALQKVQARLESANKDLDSLVTTRTKAIRRKLRDVGELPADEAEKLIDE